jgi:hypothetical protein
MDTSLIEYFSNPFDFYAVTALFVFGFLLIFCQSKLLSSNVQVGHVIYLWHTLFAAIFIAYSANLVSDSTSYYLASLNLNEYDFKFGTNLTYIFTDFLVSQFHLSYISTSLIFSLFSCLGLVFLYASLREVSNFNQKFKWIIFMSILLPSINFWSSGIGKDSIAFFGICLLIWGFINVNKRFIAIILGFVFLLFIRPHVAVVFLPVLGVLVLRIITKLNFKIKIIIMFLSFLLAIYLIYFGVRYAGLSLINIDGYFSSRLHYTSSSASGFEAEGVNLLSILFNFLYFPVLYESFNIKILPLMLEGIFLFCLSILTFYKGKLKNIQDPLSYITILISFFTLLFILGNSLGNYGLLFRQKIMLIPVLYYALFSLIGSKT